MLQVAVWLLFSFLRSLQVFAKQAEYGGVMNLAIVLRGEDFEKCHQVLNIFILPSCLRVSYLSGECVLKALLLSKFLGEKVPYYW